MNKKLSFKLNTALKALEASQKQVGFLSNELAYVTEQAELNSLSWSTTIDDIEEKYKIALDDAETAKKELSDARTRYDDQQAKTLPDYQRAITAVQKEAHIESERELENLRMTSKEQKQAEVDEVRSCGQRQIDTLRRSLGDLQLRYDATSRAKSNSEEELLGLEEKFAALQAELEKANSTVYVKDLAIGELTKRQEKEHVVQSDIATLLEKLQADPDSANCSQTITKGELETERARLERVNKEKDDLEKALAVEQIRRSKAESEVQELTVGLARCSEETRNFRSHTQLVEAAFRTLKRNAKSTLGRWLESRIIGCLLQSRPANTTSVHEVLCGDGIEPERLLLGKSWEKVVSQQGVEHSSQDQEHAI